MTTTPDGTLDGLGFLVGRWRGSGEWGGKPFVCHTRAARLDDGTLRLDVTAEQDGRPAHEEHALFHVDAERVVAVLRSGDREEQRFEVQELAHGSLYRLVFTPPAGSELSPQRWSIRRTETGRTRFVVDFDQIIEGKRPDVDVESGDLVYVPETFF